MSTTNPPNAAAPLALVRQELPNLQAILALNARPGTDVATIAQQELLYLEQISLTTPAILECEPFSIVMAVKGIMKRNITIDPQAGLAYVKTRSVKINNQWKKVLDISPSANGLISINRQLGRILDYTNPAVIKNAEGRCIGGSMRILLPSYPQPRWEEYEYDESDIKRWQRASHKENSRTWKSDSGKPAPDDKTLNYANALYTSTNGGVDKEFLKSKIIRHSLGKKGTNPNEIAGIKVYDVANEIVVDPAVDYIASSDGEFTPHEDMGSTITTPTDNSEIPNADEL